jgi:hypothetical protein
MHPMPDHDTPSSDDARRAAKREYNRAYWSANADRLKALAALRYAAKHAERLKGAASYRQRNRDTIRVKKKAFEQANPDHVAAHRAASQLRRRARAILHYGGPHPSCACCGETTPGFLTIDHVNGDGAAHRAHLGTSTIYGWLHTHGYPEGFRVLCMQCNWADGVYGRCPHVDPTAGNFALIPRRWDRSAIPHQLGRKRRLSDSGADEAP